MSDSENAAQPQEHATTGGKSLAAVERPRYKSWRKKYRKMVEQFHGGYAENRKLFKEEQKLEGIARRLREELDGILDMLLDLNQNPALPPSLRYDISLSENHTAVGSIPSVVRDHVTPQEANELLQQYTAAVQNAQIPALDLHVIRDQIDRKLAAQEVTILDELETQVPRPTQLNTDALESFGGGKAPANFLTLEEEDAYLLRIDARLGDAITRTQVRDKDALFDDKYWIDLTPREVERHVELRNPQSQHNWLKAHTKPGTTGAEIDDNESLASRDAKPATNRGGKGKRDLAKQVGDRAVGRAREGFSPSAASAEFGDDDELAFVDEHPASAGKKRAKADPDGTYRVKGGKSAGGKGKRKRSGEDVAAGAGGKKVKTDD